MLRKLIFLFIALIILFAQVNSAMAQSMTHPSYRKVIDVIEYYDYTCPHCRNMSARLDYLQVEYPNLKLIYRPVPVLHSDSRAIASVILVSVKRGKSFLHHEAISCAGSLDIHQLLAMARQAGLQPEDLLQQAKQPAIQAELENNIRLAERYSEEGVIRLPILVIETDPPSSQPPFILRGEQSYALLAAIVEQLGGHHVPVVEKSKQ